VLSSRHKIKGQICPYRGPSFMGFAIRKVMATKKKKKRINNIFEELSRQNLTHQKDTF
jgi:hypothetical protein